MSEKARMSERAHWSLLIGSLREEAFGTELLLALAGQEGVGRIKTRRLMIRSESFPCTI
jgi:hypothetical protein